MLIYKVTNKLNGKIYIGQTIQSLQKRWSHHCHDKKRCCRALANAIAKYGCENFTVEQIDVACNREELDAKEIYWIKFYDSMNPKKGYNLLGGGNKKHTVGEETRKLIGLASRGHKCPEHVKIALSVARKGKPRPKDITEKMRQTKIRLGLFKGEKNYSFGRFGKDSVVAKGIINITLNQRYDSATQAALSVGRTDCSSIIKCCKGKRKTAHGYKWEYVK